MREKECYIGVKKCGCVVAATVIDPAWTNETAKDVADFIKNGLDVERTTTAFARTNLKRCRCGEQMPLLPGSL
jgi:hypothetical protein